MNTQPIGLTVPQARHHFADVNGKRLHYVTAGDVGSPVLLVHGFPESWWAFRGLIPALAARHRVIAVDLRGFGDSAAADPGDTSATIAKDLHVLVGELGMGAVHLVAQDISGTAAFRLAASNPGDVLSFTGVETGFAGFGIEALANVAKGGAWYIGLLATQGVAETFLAGREEALIGKFIMPFATVVKDAATPRDVAEFARGYARPGGWSGARVLYGSMLKEGSEIQELAKATAPTLQALAVERAGRSSTRDALMAMDAFVVRHETISNVGHYIAQEAPDALAGALAAFFADVDAGASAGKVCAA